jgi:hypothetical protein
MNKKHVPPGTYEATVESVKVRKVRNQPFYRIKIIFKDIINRETKLND